MVDTAVAVTMVVLLLAGSLDHRVTVLVTVGEAPHRLHITVTHHHQDFPDLAIIHTLRHHQDYLDTAVNIPQHLLDQHGTLDHIVTRHHPQDCLALGRITDPRRVIIITIQTRPYQHTTLSRSMYISRITETLTVDTETY